MEAVQSVRELQLQPAKYNKFISHKFFSDVNDFPAMGMASELFFILEASDLCAI